MPSKLRAGGSFPYILRDDRDDTTSPQFNLSILSGIELDDVLTLNSAYIASKDNIAQRAELMDRCLKVAVKNCLIPGYEDKPLRSILSDRESWELVTAAIEGAALTVEERKKFLLPATSEAKSSANDVPLDVAPQR